MSGAMLLEPERPPAPSEALVDGPRRIRVALDLRGETLEVAGATIDLPKFLTGCARLVARSSRVSADNAAFADACERFVRAGLSALHPAGHPDAWFQVGLVPVPSARRQLSARLAELAHDQLARGVARNFFYMHKPPGLRLRFEAAAGCAAEVRETVGATVRRWQDAGLVSDREAGVYEPEDILFGGPVSMPFVHTMFTLDALAWLRYHAHRPDAGGSADDAWLMSLAMLREVFKGLSIEDGEDLGVWQRIREHGRRLDGAELAAAEAVGDTLRAAWSAREGLLELLGPAASAAVTEHREALLTAASAWREGYFLTDAAVAGPRAAVAWYTIFHWNRGGLAAAEQALLTEGLLFSGRSH